MRSKKYTNQQDTLTHLINQLNYILEIVLARVQLSILQYEFQVREQFLQLLCFHFSEYY